MMAVKPILFAGAVFGTVLIMGTGTPAAADPPNASSPSADGDIARLAEAVRVLEARVAGAEARAKNMRGDNTLARDRQLEEAPGASPGIAAPQPAGNSGGDKIHYKGLAITLGGFAEAAGIYRSRNDVSDISSNFGRIPFANSPLAHTSEFRGTARQSRISLLVQGDVSSTTHVAFYSEIDFQAGAQTSNSVESNSYVPRIRHFYGTLDWDDFGLHLLAGQNWSLVTMNSNGITPRNEVPPAVIDGQYVPGFVWARQPQIRITKDWSQTVWAAMSLENSQTTFSSPATGVLSTANGVSVLTTSGGLSGFDSANSLSINHLPDIVGKLAYEPKIGDTRPLHMEVFGIWRNYSDRINIASGNALGLQTGAMNSSVDGGGVGAGILATAIPNRLDLQASILTGRGVGRYGSAQIPDATMEPAGKISPITETMFLLGGTLHVTPQLDFYVFGGEERANARYFDAAGAHFGFGNPAAILSEAACTTEGGVCVPNVRNVEQITAGFWHKLYTGAFGQVRVGVQYSHTELQTFAGSVGYAPTTSADMVFTSFRYYPF